MYYLHANGSATVKTRDNKTTFLHAEGGETLSIIAGGTITTSATSVSGLAAQVSYNHELVGPVGITGSLTANWANQLKTSTGPQLNNF